MGDNIITMKNIPGSWGIFTELAWDTEISRQPFPVSFTDPWRETLHHITELTAQGV